MWGEMAFVLKAWDEAHPFGETTVVLQPSGRTFRCMLAETREQKARGMIGRTFDGFDGMLFAYDEPVGHSFHMNGVPVQLHIAWFSEDGRIVDHVGMFTSDPWTYTPPARYRWALELPVASGDTFSWLDGQTLTVK